METSTIEFDYRAIVNATAKFISIQPIKTYFVGTKVLNSIPVTILVEAHE